MTDKYVIQITNFTDSTTTLIEKNDTNELDIYNYVLKQLWIMNISAPAYIFFRDEYRSAFKQLHRHSRHAINYALNARYGQCYNDNWTGLYSMCLFQFPTDITKKNIDVLHETYHFLNRIYQDNYMEKNTVAIDIIVDTEEID